MPQVTAHVIEPEAWVTLMRTPAGSPRTYAMSRDPDEVAITAVPLKLLATDAGMVAAIDIMDPFQLYWITSQMGRNEVQDGETIYHVRLHNVVSALAA